MGQRQVKEFRNEVYKGIGHWKGIPYKGQCVPVIDPETFRGSLKNLLRFSIIYCAKMTVVRSIRGCSDSIGLHLEIERCPFPDDLLYDVDNNT